MLPLIFSARSCCGLRTVFPLQVRIVDSLSTISENRAYRSSVTNETVDFIVALPACNQLQIATRLQAAAVSLQVTRIRTRPEIVFDARDQIIN